MKNDNHWTGCQVTSQACFCVGPENCTDKECPFVKALTMKKVKLPKEILRPGPVEGPDA